MKKNTLIDVVILSCQLYQSKSDAITVPIMSFLMKGYRSGSSLPLDYSQPKLHQ